MGLVLATILPFAILIGAGLWIQTARRRSMLLIRAALSRMDVPTRTSYGMAVVSRRNARLRRA
jgi:hypothetical protein